MGFFIIAIGIGLISHSVVSGARALWFRRHSHAAVGRVVENEIGDSRPYASYPIVEFETAEGQKVKFRSDFGARPALYDPGDELPVRYLDGFPEKARIERHWQVWWDSVGLGTLGILIMMGGMKLSGIL